MNPEVKTKWLAALRSGDYKQGRNVLGRVDADSGEEFCCLGVLCELAEKEGVVKRKLQWDYFVYGRSEHYLPESVQRWSGMDGGRGDRPVAFDSLSALNDRGYTFDQIADIIEAEF